MEKILLILALSGQPQQIIPMDSAGDCVIAARVGTKIYDSMKHMVWCGRGGCNYSAMQITCWDSKENKAIEIPVDTK